MAQWYNHIFYKDGDQPKPDAPILDSYTTLPIVDETSDLPNEEEVAQTSKLEFMFRQNFYFTGLPTNPEDQKKFFTQNQNRESDPAELRQIDDAIPRYKSIYQDKKTLLSTVVVTPLVALYNVTVWGLSKLPDWANLKKRIYDTNPYAASGGTRKNTKKRHSYRRRQMNKTQRRLLAVDDR